MKADWNFYPLEAVCLVRRGTTITNKEAVSGDVPVVGGGLLPTYYHNASNRPAGTITVSASGANAGYVNRYSVPIFASDCSTINLVDEQLLLTDFVFRFLQSKQQFINSELRRGAAQPHVYASDLAKLEIPIPPMDEQRRIVAVLDKAFAGIATTTANAQTSLTKARALFEDSVKETFRKSADMQPWAECTVATAAAEHRGAIRTGPFGSQLLHSEFTDEGIAVLGIDNAVANEFRWDKLRFISSQKYQELTRYRVYPGDVIITIMGTCGRCAVIPDDIPLAINSKHLCCITVDNKKCLPKFLHLYFLYHPIAQEYLGRTAKGSIMAGLNMGLIKEMPLRLPKISEQERLVAKFIELKRTTNALVNNLETKLAALSDLKQSLLQKALAGKLT